MPRLIAGLPADVVARSEAHGQAVAAHILAWSRDRWRRGRSRTWASRWPIDLAQGPAQWVPTSLIAQQQTPLLPGWGNDRTFAMPQGAACPLPPPPAYSEDKASAFFKEALEVYETRQNLSTSSAPSPASGRTIRCCRRRRRATGFRSRCKFSSATNVGLDKSVDVLARLGVALADAFIGCWDSKYQYNLLRPVTYIRRLIDPKWEPLLITPPFPEYPSGHSTQSGAAAAVLTALFGENFAFEDDTAQGDGLKPRAFPSFWAAAEEAGISRLYGGIHFRAAIERASNRADASAPMPTRSRPGDRSCVCLLASAALAAVELRL